MKKTILPTLFKSIYSLAFLVFTAQVSHAETTVSHQLYSPNTVRWLISQPQVNLSRLPNSYETEPQAFNLGVEYLSLITVSAGGCVQTGGKGLTWKRYVDPQGENSDHLYHGYIGLPGLGMMRLVDFFANYPFGYVVENRNVSDFFVKLAYEDDGPSDNGYTAHDNGTGDQCKNVGDAWVAITVQHQ
jgi:hypothetical protein